MVALGNNRQRSAPDLGRRASAAEAVAERPADLEWLLRMRWGATAGQGLTILGAGWGLDLALPFVPLLGLVLLGALSDVALTWRVRRGGPVSAAVLGGAMLFDVLLLTGLLALSGGASNPFNFLYLVAITLSAVVLPGRWARGLVALSILCFGLLFLVPGAGHLPAASGSGSAHFHAGMSADAAGEAAEGAPHDHAKMLEAAARGEAGAGAERMDAAALEASSASRLMELHLPGMWVAFAVAAVFIVYFVERVMGVLRERDRELGLAREATSRSEKLAALATLSAGAAHELATPLSTIAVASKELQRDLEATDAESARAAGLIRSEVERCRAILAELGARSGESLGETPRQASLAELFALAVEGLSPSLRARVRAAAPEATLALPVGAVARVLTALLRNALDASTENAGATVMLRAEAPARGPVTVFVEDRGAGMDAAVLARATEPFFTTKAPGAGMGLGLFLAQEVMRQLGGELALRSEPGAGTTVTLCFPRIEFESAQAPFRGGAPSCEERAPSCEERAP